MRSTFVPNTENFKTPEKARKDPLPHCRPFSSCHSPRHTHHIPTSPSMLFFLYKLAAPLEVGPQKGSLPPPLPPPLPPDDLPCVRVNPT